MNRHINVSMIEEEAVSLKAEDYACLTGTTYTVRDAVHEWMDKALDRGEALSFDAEGSITYYMGPPPAREGRPTGSIGPITASRMDKYTLRFLDLGMRAIIGRGKRSRDVMNAIVYGGVVYFAAVGGIGAILSECVFSSEIVAYEDLGTEAVRRLTTQDSPVVVIMDTFGNNLYEVAVKEFCTLQREDAKQIMYTVLIDLLHASTQFFTTVRMAREEGARAAAEKYGYISKVVKRISRRGGVAVTTMETEYTLSKGGLILFPNHQGLFDMFTLSSTCPRPLFIVIKEETSNRTLIKQVLGAIKSFAINGDDIEDQVRTITEVTKLVKLGRNFVISAEGHRSHNGNEIPDFKSGASRSAVKAGRPIVPVALTNPFRPFDMDSLKREEVQVHYMKPILSDRYMEMKTSEIAHLVYDRIQEEINRSLIQNGSTSQSLFSIVVSASGGEHV